MPHQHPRHGHHATNAPADKPVTDSPSADQDSVTNTAEPEVAPVEQEVPITEDPTPACRPPGDYGA